MIPNHILNYIFKGKKEKDKESGVKKRKKEERI
jgi:hypothetical protein